MGSSDSGKTTIRYAPYLEDHHFAFLGSVVGYRSAVIDNSPYESYDSLNIDSGFFGTGYTLSNFPSLYDMFGKFLSGMDIDVLYKKLFADTFGIPDLKSCSETEAALLDDGMSTNIIPKFLTASRDLNAVACSSFVIGKSGLEIHRLKLLTKFNNALKYELLPFITSKWTAYLNFQKTVVIDQAFILKLYFSAKMFVDDSNYEKVLRHKLWPFTVLEYERAALAAMRNMVDMRKAEKERSGLSKGLLVASYTVQGAIIGSYFPPYGTYIGGAIGFVVGLAIVLLE